MADQELDDGNAAGEVARRTGLLIAAALGIVTVTVLALAGTLGGSDPSDDRTLVGPDAATQEQTPASDLTEPVMIAPAPSVTPIRSVTPRPTTTTTTTTSSTPSPEPVPAAAARPPTPRATAVSPDEGTGTVDATVTLAKPDVRVGERVGVTVTVTNNRSAQIVLLDNTPSCSSYATATYAVQAVPLALLSPRRQAFRDSALSARPRPEVIELTPDVPCKQGFRPMEPGVRITRTFTWTASSPNGVVYDDDVTLAVEVFWDQPYMQATTPVTLRVHLTGGDPGRLTSAQALDRALADPQFGAAVDRAAEPVRGGIGFSDGRYVVSIALAPAEAGLLATAQVDGGTGQVSRYTEARPPSS